MPFSRPFLYISPGAPKKQGLLIKQNLIFIRKSLVQEPPPLHGPPQRGPYGERYSVSKTSGLFVHLYPSESPVKELSHENRVKDTVTVHGTPRGRKVYMQWGAARFPKGIVNDTAVTTPVPCSFRHVTFHLGLGRPEPS